MFLTPIQAVVKVTDKCNLRCPNCYFFRGMQDECEHGAMSLEVFEEIVFGMHSFRRSRHSKNRKKADIIFHGGEPLIVGQERISKMLDICEKYDVTKSLMTNAVLINRSWRSTLKRFDSIGISLNGDRIGNQDRIFEGGKETFDLVVEKFHLLRSWGMSPGICCVINKHNVTRPKETLNFFNNLLGKGYLQYIPEHKPEYSQQDLLNFLNATFDHWVKINNEHFIVDTVEMAVQYHNRLDLDCCELSSIRVCGIYPVFFSDGSLAPCDNLIVREGLKPYANLNKVTLRRAVYSWKWIKKVFCLRCSYGCREPAHHDTFKTYFKATDKKIKKLKKGGE